MPFNACCKKASRIWNRFLMTPSRRRRERRRLSKSPSTPTRCAASRSWKARGRTACCVLINGRRLALVQANRDLLESLLNPGEEPSAKLYIALAQQYPQRFAWSLPRTKQSDEERRADFSLVCRQNNLSECVANEKLHKDGIDIEHWAGASQVELHKFQADAALARQKWLVNSASPTELKIEARYETQTQLAASQQAHADASLEAYKQRDQYAGYKPLPAHIDRKALINASKDELRKWSRLYGQFQLNTALRAQQ
jgi:hypothetical protein